MEEEIERIEENSKVLQIELAKSQEWKKKKIYNLKFKKN
jgi:hypothetical protein